MHVNPFFKKPLSKYNRKHLPRKILTLIKSAGLSKPEFFEKFPTYDYRIEPFPKVLIDKINIKRKLRQSSLKQAHRDLARHVERLSLHSPIRLEKLRRRKVEFLPSTSRATKPVARVRPRARSPYPRAEIVNDSDPEYFPPSVENPSYSPPSVYEVQPPSIQEIPSPPTPPSPFPEIEIIPPPSIEFIPQLD